MVSERLYQNLLKANIPIVYFPSAKYIPGRSFCRPLRA